MNSQEYELEQTVEAFKQALDHLEQLNQGIGSSSNYQDQFNQFKVLFKSVLVEHLDRVRRAEDSAFLYGSFARNLMMRPELTSSDFDISELWVSDDTTKAEAGFEWAIRTYQNASSIAESIVSQLIESLSAENAQVRAEAALALGSIGNETAIPALCRVLELDQNPEVRRTAAEALGMIGVMKTES